MITSSNTQKQRLTSSLEMASAFFHFSSYIGTFSTRSSTLHTNTRAIFNNVSVCALLMSFLRCSYC